MVALHAFLALAAGFCATVVVVAVIAVLVRRLTPGWAVPAIKPAPGYVAVNLCGTFLAAAAGGCVTSWAAKANPLQHVEVLGIILLVFAALSGLQSRGKLPIWYQLLLIAITPFGALAGGLAHLLAAGHL
jgi:hypothetical protein